ncbi:MAG: hypothetical protein IJA72_02520 [Clostridia bacterium]|nr:hypothetical protein [Clostridia bacterium]
MNFPKYYNYGRYSSDNYGVHTLCFEDGKNAFWFSYDTMVAFRINGEFHIVKNYWGNTTGKHLNWIDNNKNIREDIETFENNYKRLSGNE